MSSWSMLEVFGLSSENSSLHPVSRLIPPKYLHSSSSEMKETWHDIAAKNHWGVARSETGPVRQSTMHGGQDIDFEEDLEFSKRYRLRGGDEPAVRQLFHVGVRQQLLSDSAWCIECAADSVVLYRRSKRVSPDDLASFIEKARRLFESVSAR